MTHRIPKAAQALLAGRSNAVLLFAQCLQLGSAFSLLGISGCEAAAPSAPNMAWMHLDAIHVGLLTLCAFGLALEQRALAAHRREVAPFARLVDLAHIVAAFQAAWRRRTHAFTTEAHQAGTRSLERFAARVHDELAHPHDGLSVDATDLSRVLFELEAHQPAVPTPIYVPAPLLEAMDTAWPWSGAKGLVLWLPMRIASLVWRGFGRRIVVGVALLGDMARFALDLGDTRALVVLLALGVTIRATRSMAPRFALDQLAAGADPRLHHVLRCRAILHYNEHFDPDLDDLAWEHELRSRVADATVLVAQFGPLGRIGQREWRTWLGQTGGLPQRQQPLPIASESVDMAGDSNQCLQLEPAPMHEPQQR